MRVKASKNKNSISYSIIKDFKTKAGKRTTKIVKALGNREDIAKAHPEFSDPLDWAKKQAEILTQKEKAGNVLVIKQYDTNKLIERNKPNQLNIGYLFLQHIYYELKLNEVCFEIKDKLAIKFDLNKILAQLIYTRILFPNSKKASYDLFPSLLTLNTDPVKLHDIYRGLTLLAENTDYLLAKAYENSRKITKRNTHILFYDCTNYFFEIEQEDGIKRYGVSKEHRPNPIIQMGLFMDGSGIPLAFSLFDGNKNEQPSLKPLEKKILKDFKLSEVVVCTDAGLSSNSNRKFNDRFGRHFVTTQSIKKLPANQKAWALAKNGWRRTGSSRIYSLNQINLETNNHIYYKKLPIHENNLEQYLFVTFSPKHLRYQRHIRKGQIERAFEKLDHTSSLKHKKPNDPVRFIKEKHFTIEGEKATKTQYIIDQSVIKEEQKYDGFYGVCTNLEATAEELIAINKQRWDIEQCFRTLKTDFKARPVYLQREDRIKAHFLTCFIALLIWRLLKSKLPIHTTNKQLQETLRNMNVAEIKGEGYIPIYPRTELTDILHETFNFRTDTELITIKKFKEILKKSERKK